MQMLIYYLLIKVAWYNKLSLLILPYEKFYITTEDYGEKQLAKSNTILEKDNPPPSNRR